MALPPPGHAPTENEMTLRREVGMRIAQGGGAVIVGIPVGTKAFVQSHHEEGGTTEKRAEALTRLLAPMPDK